MAMADFYFFTDTDLLNFQSAGDAFGPVDGFETTQYRLFSAHKSSNDANAYAVCSGTVFVQQNNSDPTLVNLVLKPTIQPGFGFPSIAYFIYRGIKKGSIITSGGTDIVASGTNDLATSIWESQNKRNESLDKAQGNAPGTTTDTPPVELLGINYSSMAVAPYLLEDDELLSKVFFATDLEYQLATVKGGWSMGKFDSIGFGFDIVFASLSKKVTAGDIRNNDSIVEIPELTGGESQAEVFTHWNLKERILMCCDPAAFFGSFYSEGLMAKNSVDTAFSSFSGDDLYTEILAKFQNKNRVYLDIRNEINYSFNYYKNYNDELLISFDEVSALSNINYYRDNWPILIIDTDFPPGNTTSINLMRITFPKGDNDFPRLFINKGSSEDSFPDNVSFDYQFFNLLHDSVSTYNFNEIEILTPNFIGTDTTPVANYLRLTYLKSLPGLGYRPTHGTVPQAEIGIDNLFQPLHLKIDWKENLLKTQIQIFNELHYVDMRIFNKHSYMAKQGIAKTPSGDALYFAFSSQTLETDRENSPEIILESQENIGNTIFNLLINNTASLLSNFTVEIDGTSVALEQISNFFDGEIGQPLILNPHEFVYVWLTSADVTTINNIIADPVHGFLSDFPILFSIKLGASGFDDNYRVSYNRFDYGINGYYQNTGTNEIEIKSVDTGIHSYRLLNNLK